jgi:hypothetical protein
MHGVDKGKNIWISPNIEMVMHRLVRSSRQLSLKSLMPANARYDRHLEKFVGDVAVLYPTAKFTVRDNCMARSAHSLCGADRRDVNDDDRDHRDQGGGVKLQVLSKVHGDGLEQFLVGVDGQDVLLSRDAGEGGHVDIRHIDQIVV